MATVHQARFCLRAVVRAGDASGTLRGLAALGEAGPVPVPRDSAHTPRDRHDQ
jgi:hypothetical protein